MGYRHVCPAGGVVAIVARAIADELRRRRGVGWESRVEWSGGAVVALDVFVGGGGGLLMC